MTTEVQLVVLCSTLLSSIIGLNAQFHFVQKHDSSPIPSAPIIDEGNPFEFASLLEQRPPTLELQPPAQFLSKYTDRNDANQQINQLSPPAGLFNTESNPSNQMPQPLIGSTGPVQQPIVSPPNHIHEFTIYGGASGSEQQQIFNQPTPAPEYGPPPSAASQASTVSKLSSVNNLVFVPAFPAGPPNSEAAPPSPISGNGFVPANGALFAPPPPVINGTPLPSPRNPSTLHISYRRLK